MDGPAICPGCRNGIDRTPGRALVADGIDAGFAALPYEAGGRRLVHALKYSRLLIAAELGAALIASRAPPSLLSWAVVPVPPAPLRLARRGFDPAAEIAGALAAASGLELLPLLRRGDLRRQRGSSRRQRLGRPPSVTAAGSAPLRVVLIDDVVTTGATIDACAGALRQAGAGWIGALAVAAAEPPGSGVARPGTAGVEWTAPGNRRADRRSHADRDRRTRLRGR